MGARLRLDRAKLEYELNGTDVRHDVEWVSLLYRKRDVIEGHLWDPYEIKPFTDQIPFALTELKWFADHVGAAPPDQRRADEVHNRYVRYPVLLGPVPYPRPVVGPVQLAIHRDRNRGTEMLTLAVSAVSTVEWSDDHTHVEGWANLDGTDHFVRAVYRVGKRGSGIAGSVAVFAD
ncbi:hypothetical protein Mvan_5983 [Mycolicibacterium vanbaalenii PYR-1]|uniref:Uncharacterized protein n=1 Tax=Mycolicibacterium vanbaalenii (strain DSM 7251 / JCM 13017 / BCRC 16820 / KCTC 9966 / NRRL B-24157 / PYR-1) TaxID=350058 RepID=A1THT9_MYCVP|nr:hypothetical protein [Mycolicibacterium vanbaalenii]ABM16739.1 hypothetical protein Mvan_5983 [Mycolicibacterium vanbaalenii PYR-1]